MLRFSFRSPTKKKTTTSAVMPSRQPLNRRPLLDDLASPDIAVASVSVESSEDDDVNHEGIDDDDTDDERERLRRARARAQRLGRSTPFLSTAVRMPDMDAADDDNDSDDDKEEAPLSVDVIELQRQVRALLEAQRQAEDLWRRETARLHEQLRVAQARTGSSGPTDSTATMTPRERELLRLVIRIVGSDQIRALLAASPSSTPADLRRRLVACVTKAKAPRASAPTTTTSKGTELLLCGARKHEMSAAIK